MSENLSEAMFELKRAAKRAQAAQEELKVLHRAANEVLKANQLGQLRQESDWPFDALRPSIEYDPAKDVWNPGEHRTPGEAAREATAEATRYAERVEKRSAVLRALQMAGR